MKHKRGFTLLAAIFILLVMVLLAITTSTYVASDAVMAVKNYYSQDALYIASAGLEYYVAQLHHDDDWSSPPPNKIKSFSGGVFIVETTAETRNSIVFRVTGLLTIGASTYKRMIEPVILRGYTGGGGLAALLDEYVIYWGGSGGTSSSLGNNVTIIGDIFVNTDLEMGSNSLISGDAMSTGDITLGSGTSVTGTVEIGVAPPDDPPTLETTHYDNQIAVAAAYPIGNESWDSKTISGATYINGDLTFKNNANITLTGVATIVVTGKATVSQNVIFGDNLTLIAGGMVDIANNVDIGESGLWYSGTGIEVGNNANVGEVTVGDGTIFITPGDVDFGNNIEYYGFLYVGGDFVQTGNNFYYEGNIIVEGSLTVDNNTTMQLNPDLFDIEDLIGITGGGSGGGVSGEAFVDITGWDEVY